MFEFMRGLLDTSGFPARWKCGHWTALHGWTHIVSDVAIFGAYAAIPAALAYFVMRRGDLPFQKLFWLFVAFICSCGLGHLLEATIFWHPWYRLAGAVKVVTAMTSWVTVLALIPVLPRALALPGLAASNQRLQGEIAERTRAEERFRRVVEFAPNAIVMIDQAGQIVLVNGQTEQLFGYCRNELLGQAVEILVPERFRGPHPGYRAGFFAAPECRAMGVGRDLFGQRRDGSEVPVEIGLTPIETEDGLLVLSAIVDITERKEAEAQIHRLNADLERRVKQRTGQLEAANKELEAFTYTVSHDLRAPLRAIDGFSRIVLQEHGEAMPAEAREYLQDVRANTQQMGQLVDDLLAFSRLGRQAINKQRVEAAEVVQRCLEELCGQQAGRQVEIITGELAPCWGDVSLLKQVWMNLLSNALKYTARREVALIEIGSQPGDASEEQVYFVKDNGVGFDMRYAQKLFGVFQRFHRAEDYEGTGVGLAIVQRIVHRHGGRVWAEAEPDKGAIFRFALPDREGLAAL
jgi:PAS domain S-box-containing protein